MKSNFYFTQFTSNTSPQLETISLHQAHAIRTDEFPGEDLDLKFKLSEHTKLTDFLSQASISAIGYVVSQKVKDIFESFNLIDHKFYPVTIENLKNPDMDKYYWMHLLRDTKALKWLDFHSSQFIACEVGFKEYDIDLVNIEDYYKFKKEKGTNWSIEAESLYLNNSFPSYDLFFFYRFSFKCYFNDKLKNHLMENKVTGVEFIKGPVFKTPAMPY